MPAARISAVFVLLAAAGVASIGHACAKDEAKVRPAGFAGTWYPADPAELTKQIDGLLDKHGPPKTTGKPVALISPHAGYRFSAPVAAAAYAALRGHTYKRVIVLALDHRYAGSYKGVDVPDDLSAYATPLGDVALDREAFAALRTSELYGAHTGVGAREHSLELQLPFLQRALGSFSLVPLLVGRMSDDDCARAAHALLPLIDDETLLVASTDFTHFGPNYGYQPFSEDVPTRLRDLADKAATAIERCDYDGFAAHLDKTSDTICGRGAVRLLLRVLSMRGGARATRAAFDTSGQITGDWTNSVTYQSFVFTPRQGTLAADERDRLLKMARATVKAYLQSQEVPAASAADLPAKLRGDGACFVTLQNHGELRGCIGNMLATGPLYEAVISNAVAACRDRRFVHNPVTAGELDDLDIEISYLTPMQRMKSTGDIIIGQHGLLIARGGRRGVLLPQVAYERGWRREEFLAQTCRKAGLPNDAWKQRDTEIYSFEAEVFGEPGCD